MLLFKHLSAEIETLPRKSWANFEYLFLYDTLPTLTSVPDLFHVK